MKSSMKKYIIAAVLCFQAACAAAQETPITVTEFITKEQLVPAAANAPAVAYLGSIRPIKKFSVKGYVQKIFHCPPCPAGAECEPCAESIAISDSPQACPTENCSNTLQLFLDYTNNYTNITAGTEITLEVERSMSVRVVQTITPEQRQRSATDQQLLKGALNQQFKPAKPQIG